MVRKTAYAAAFLLQVLVPMSNAMASDEVPLAGTEEVPYFLIVGAQAEMEKCFALSDAKSKECVADPDSGACKASEKKGKDGTEFKYVPRDTCIKLGGLKVMAKRPKPQK